MSNRKSPREVDPDSRMRTYLSNERTFLSWLRTGVTLIALGLVAAQFLAREVVGGVPLTRGIAIALVLSGIFVALAGARRYFQTSQQIQAEQFRPSTLSIVVSTLLTALIGAMSIVFILLLGP